MPQDMTVRRHFLGRVRFILFISLVLSRQCSLLLGYCLIHAGRLHRQVHEHGAVPREWGPGPGLGAAPAALGRAARGADLEDDFGADGREARRGAVQESVRAGGGECARRERAVSGWGRWSG
ncbi:hypothetical protein B0H14DRAFT_2842328 [Mycena olivaceomarginata]|nr:hypothetical protein B0H14DRAFT_2842328 [Mycena olivaceomarginata]